jgi:hypothetical protein
MVAWRARRWTLGGRTRSMAMRVSKARRRDDDVGVMLIPAAIAGAIQWPLLMSILLVLYRTCFWAGDTFAPKLRMRDGVPIQRFLQDAFLDMWETVARAVGDLDSVLGFEVCCLISC